MVLIALILLIPVLLYRGFRPDCDLCGAIRHGHMHGSYWHEDDCPVVTTEPVYPGRE